MRRLWEDNFAGATQVVDGTEPWGGEKLRACCEPGPHWVERAAGEARISLEFKYMEPLLRFEVFDHNTFSRMFRGAVPSQHSRLSRC